MGKQKQKGSGGSRRTKNHAGRRPAGVKRSRRKNKSIPQGGFYKGLT